MKTCTKCGAEKPLSDFNKNRCIPGGYEYQCKECRRAWYRANYRKNPEHRARILRWQAENPERLAAIRSRHAPRKKVSRLKWNKENHPRLTAKWRLRRAARREAMPSWLTPLDRAAIDLIYEMARWKSRETGELYVVDHIYPLRGKTVCGLHVPGNLRVIRQAENLSKGCRLIEFP